MRHMKALLTAIIAAAAGVGAWASTALADSEPPPPDTVTTSNSGTIVVVTLSVIVIVLVSVAVLRSVARGRRERWIEEQYEARRGTEDGSAAPHADADERPDL